MLPSACFKSTVLTKSGLEFSWISVLFGAKWCFAWISSIWLIECVYTPSLLFVDGNRSAEQHGEMVSSGTNTIENKMCVWEREHVSGKKRLLLFPVKLMVRLEKTQFLWGVYLNCDTKDTLKRQRDHWHHSAVLLTVATNLLLVWTPGPKGSLKEESELEAMLELGEGFGIRRAAVEMKFGAVQWLKPLSHEAFCSMDTVELRFSVWGVFCRYILHHIEFHTRLEEGQKYNFTHSRCKRNAKPKESLAVSLWIVLL